MWQLEYLQGKVMAPRSRHQDHDKYKARIKNLFKTYAEDEDCSPESQAHNAKYLAVLVSGYLEQAIKELLLHYASLRSEQQISKYIEGTWPRSKNMTADSIDGVLNNFHTRWSDEFNIWLVEKDNRKSHINSIVQWRNYIAHGQEAKTTGVTLVSVRNAFSTIEDLVLLIENMVKP